MGTVSGASSRMYVGGRPFWIAAEYTIGLKVDPGCRSACTARLNLESSKSRPPTIARTAPVRGSIATNAPWRYGEFGELGVSPPLACAMYRSYDSWRYGPYLPLSMAWSLRSNARTAAHWNQDH